MRTLILATVLAVTGFGSTAKALTLPDLGQVYFVGTTAHLYKIRAAIAKAAGYEQLTWTPPYNHDHQVIFPPWGLGAVDCMTAFPEDALVAQSLGMSVELNGEVIEIPAYEDLADQTNWPGECYGYKFALHCTSTWLDPEMLCPDP